MFFIKKYDKEVKIRKLYFLKNYLVTKNNDYQTNFSVLTSYHLNNIIIFIYNIIQYLIMFFKLKVIKYRQKYLNKKKVLYLNVKY
jgi:hypothetical protein